MASHFTSDFFKNNRQRLRSQLSDDAPIVVAGNGLLQRGADSTYHFEQDANFWYLSGVNQPDAVLVITPEEEFFIVPTRSASRQAFDGSVDTAIICKRAGVDAVYDENEGWSKLKQLARGRKHIWTVEAPPAYIETYGMYTNPARRVLIEKIHSNLETPVEDIGQTLARMRMVKQPAELKAIQAAIDITGETLKDVLQPGNLSDYGTEYALEAAITHGFRSRGASGHAFDPIVAAGKRACTLHNVNNEGPLGKTDLVVVDVGAQIEHYAADITRTVAVGPPTQRQKEVFAAVLEVQTAARKLLKPGVMLRSYEAEVEQIMGKALKGLGLIKDITHENVRRYYPHATSHFLGLNVHDVGDYHAGLPEGAVLTVEPGIYIPEESIGVRIEDDVVLTAKGNRALSAKIAKDLG